MIWLCRDAVSVKSNRARAVMNLTKVNQRVGA